ncbi:hypothetical protein PV773_06610 [Mesorhizobium sp. CC13]|uniref:hypothetical protein n=1 Tax=Mesorhizobium sp. CC13 TaxID=3029194 RepID=UPI00326737F3
MAAQYQKSLQNSLRPGNYSRDRFAEDCLHHQIFFRPLDRLRIGVDMSMPIRPRVFASAVISAILTMKPREGGFSIFSMSTVCAESQALLRTGHRFADQRVAGLAIG